MKNRNEGMTKINKLPNSKNNNNSKVSLYGGRNELIDADLYYKLRDENIELKKKVTELTDQNKKLDVAMKYKGINPNNSNYDINTLKIENENLKNKISKMKTIIAGLQNELKKKNPNKFKKNFQPTNYEIQDYLKLIGHLQQALKDAQNDRRHLIDDLTSLKETSISSKITQYSDDIREKNTQLAELDMNFTKMKNQLETNIKILNLTKESLQEYIEKYTTERNKNRDLENQIQMMQSEVNKVNEYLDIIENYKAKEKELEEKIKELCENPYVKGQNDRDNAFLKLREAQFALSEALEKLKESEKNNKQLEKRLNDLVEQNKNLIEENAKWKEEGLRYRVINDERDKQAKQLDETLKKISSLGEVDSNYQKLLDVLKNKNVGDNNNENNNNDDLIWSDMNFLENVPPEELIKEIKKLKMEKGILGNELENTKNLLTIQQQINDDMKKIQEVDSKKYQKQIKMLKEKIKTLLDLVDKEKIPQEYYLDNTMNISNKEFTQLKKDLKEDENDEKLRQTKKNTLMQSQTVYSDITGFSLSNESDYGINENALDLYITMSKYDSDAIENKLNMNIENLLSFLTVDFYLHETQTSNLVNGPNPNYNFQLTFRVNVDEHFIKYLKDDFIQVELYYLNNNTQIIFARGKITLNKLINAEYNPRTRVIHGYIEMFDAANSNSKLCDIKYKMRMRKPIKNMIEWLNEKALIEKETNPIDFATQKITGNINENDKVIDYDNLDIHNKVYQINIEIYKASNLEGVGPQKNIMPYIYYKFFKQEHYSQIMIGFNPEFNDKASFTYIYTSNFHDYLEKEFLFIYLFDQTNPIKVNSDEKEVEMINDRSDCIGFCKIKLKQLILNNEIKGEFNIISEKDMKIIGIMSLCINWKVVNEDIIVNQINKSSIVIKEGIDPLLIKLAELMRKKKLTMRSSFNLFDTDNKNYVNLSDFRNHIVYTLNFTKKDDEIAKLVEIIFKGKTEVDLKDWYEVFDGLLPYDDETDIEKLIREKNNENVIDTNQDLRFSIDKSKNKGGLGNSFLSKGSGDVIGQSINIEQSNNLNDFNKSSFKTGKYYNNLDDNNSNNNRIYKRNTKTIMKLINDYMINWGKSQAIDLYKMFDYDADLRVGKKEMADGFGYLGIELNNDELEMIWNEIVQGDKNKNKFDFNMFKIFYDRHKIKINENNNNNN